MADLVVIVPGITGSVLRRPGGSPVWQRSLPALAGAATAPGATLDLLTLPAGLGDEAPDGPTALVPGGLVTGWHAWPGVYAGSGYHELAKLAGLLEPGAVRLFPYDWRLSNRHTARLLARAVDEWLDRWRGNGGDPAARVSFVCHSMGGLVVRYYLEVLGGREHARRVVTLGTPYSGAVKAVRALTGDAFRRIPVLGTRITELARSLPSLAQLLPSYRCVEQTAGPVRLADVDVPDLPTAAVADGLRFSGEIAAAVAANGPAPYRLHVVAGRMHDTLQSLAVTGARVTYHRAQRGTDHAGDGTVATFAAVPPEWPDTSEAEVIAMRHGMMGGSPVVRESVRNRLAPIDLGTTLAPPLAFGIGLPDVATVADGVAVEARCGRPDVILHATARPLDSDDVAAVAMVPPTGGGSYATRLALPAGMWRVEVTAVAERPPVTQADVVLVVP
jgi:hypothetical protein